MHRKHFSELKIKLKLFELKNQTPILYKPCKKYVILLSLKMLLPGSPMGNFLNAKLSSMGRGIRNNF